MPIVRCRLVTQPWPGLVMCGVRTAFPTDGGGQKKAFQVKAEDGRIGNDERIYGHLTTAIGRSLHF